MTFRINGFGTGLAGKRNITSEEFKQLKKNKYSKAILNHLVIKDSKNLKIATESFFIIFIPIIPIKSFVYYDPNPDAWVSRSYTPLIGTGGDGVIDWDHVFDTWTFFIAPAVIIFMLLSSIVSSIISLIL